MGGVVHAIVRRSICCLAGIMIWCYCAMVGADDTAKSRSDYWVRPDYNALLTKAKVSDFGVDFHELRLAYTKTKKYKPFDEEIHRLKAKMAEKIKIREYNGALKIGKKILDDNFVDAQTHLYCANACLMAGDTARFRYHLNISIGLVESILACGDGQTKQTAYPVIEFAEEYAIMDLMNVRSLEAEIIYEGNQVYDSVMAVDEKTGDTLNLYFNVSIPWNHELDAP